MTCRAFIHFLLLLSQVPTGWSAEPTSDENHRFLESLANNTEITRSLRTNTNLKKSEDQGRFKTAIAKDAALRAWTQKGLDLKGLFAGDAGVTEGYSVGEHTRRALDTFSEQEKFYRLEKTAVKGGRHDTKTFMRHALALHDIGKSLAVRAGNKKWQHEFTSPILKTSLQALKFSTGEIKLAAALIEHDIIGEMLKGEISTLQAVDKMRIQAKTAELPLPEFLNLQTLYFVSDAGAYPYLREKVFVSENGKLVPSNPKFVEFRNLLLGVSAP